MLNNKSKNQVGTVKCIILILSISNIGLKCGNRIKDETNHIVAEWGRYNTIAKQCDMTYFQLQQCNEFLDGLDIRILDTEAKVEQHTVEREIEDNKLEQKVKYLDNEIDEIEILLEDPNLEQAKKEVLIQEKSNKEQYKENEIEKSRRSSLKIQQTIDTMNNYLQVMNDQIPIKKEEVSKQSQELGIIFSSLRHLKSHLFKQVNAAATNNEPVPLEIKTRVSLFETSEEDLNELRLMQEIEDIKQNALELNEKARDEVQKLKDQLTQLKKIAREGHHILKFSFYQAEGTLKTINRERRRLQAELKKEERIVGNKSIRLKIERLEASVDWLLVKKEEERKKFIECREEVDRGIQLVKERRNIIDQENERQEDTSDSERKLHQEQRNLKIGREQLAQQELNLQKADLQLHKEREELERSRLDIGQNRELIEEVKVKIAGFDKKIKDATETLQKLEKDLNHSKEVATTKIPTLEELLAQAIAREKMIKAEGREKLANLYLKVKHNI